MSEDLGDLGGDYHEGRPTMTRGLVLLLGFLVGVAAIVLLMLLLAQLVIGWT